MVYIVIATVPTRPTACMTTGYTIMVCHQQVRVTVPSQARRGRRSALGLLPGAYFSYGRTNVKDISYGRTIVKDINHKHMVVKDIN